MAIADYTDFISTIRSPTETATAVLTVPSVASILGRWSDLWTTQVPAGAIPSTAAVPTNTTAGALGQQNGDSGGLYLVGGRFNAMNPGVYLICDRLSHQGGLSGTTTGAQTTNLGTAALTRYTSGVGVMMMATIYTAVGTTATTITVSYTDTTPTSGRTSPLVVFGGTGFREASRGVILPLAAGDVGVTSVQSVTLAASTTTAGNFGITLFKPLFAVIVDEMNSVCVADLVTGKSGGGIPEVVDNACLFPMYFGVSTNAMGTGAVILSER